MHISDTDKMTRIPEITTEELQDAIKKLKKKGESPDSDGIRTEDIKACDDDTKEMVSQIFNEIIKQNDFTPEAWEKVKIKVLHKKGDVENVSNYRPICSLPALYKLFSTILYRRLYPRLDQEQAEDQAGFRSSYQTTDDLATYRMIEQKCHVWSIKMWTATIDFTKAFDSITHTSIWKALKSCGIKRDYTSFLKKIHNDQKASVQTDVESNMFEIKKGTKQGDHLSSLLFNTVLQNSLKDVIQRWQKKKGMGIYLSDHDHDCLTNLRFADDVLLFATSKEQLQKMLCDFKKSTEKVGLRIHPEKTKILSNQRSLSSDTKKEMQVDNIRIEILTRGESVRYLGQMITFRQQETTEIKNRIRAAWATFHEYRQELTSKNYMLKHRLRLFDAAITPTIWLRIWNMGTHQRARKNDTIDATQNAPSHHTNEKKKQKDRETQKLRPAKI